MCKAVHNGLYMSTKSGMVFYDTLFSLLTITNANFMSGRKISDGFITTLGISRSHKYENMAYKINGPLSTRQNPRKYKKIFYTFKQQDIQIRQTIYKKIVSMKVKIDSKRSLENYGSFIKTVGFIKNFTFHLDETYRFKIHSVSGYSTL